MSELPNTGAMLLQTLLALGVVVLAIWGVAWVMKRLHAPSRHGPLQVVAEAPLGVRERVVLLQVGDKQVLVGVAPGRVSPIMELAEPVALQPARAPEGFASLFARLRGGR